MLKCTCASTHSSEEGFIALPTDFGARAVLVVFTTGSAIGSTRNSYRAWRDEEVMDRKERNCLKVVESEIDFLVITLTPRLVATKRNF